MMSPWSIRVAVLIGCGVLCGDLMAGDVVLPWLRDSYDPDWSQVAPRRTVRVACDPGMSEQDNGAALVRAMRDLLPGDRLEIEPGRYVLAEKISLNLQGTRQAPIVIAAADPQAPPVLTRPDARQNLLNLGESGACRYLALRHLVLTGGSVAIRFYDGAHLWLDRCELHHSQHGGITVNSRDTHDIHVTRNHLHHFLSGTGEAMYLGANHGQVRMSNSVIAANHVHDCGGEQGDGIELKQGSFNNWIVANVIHDTHYPCLITYGTDQRGVNVIERNVCYRSQDNTMQIQGEAIVRNNLIFAGRHAGFASTDHQGKTRDLQFLHNTIVTTGIGANLSSWNARESMVFANNAVYTRQGPALRFPNGAAGVRVSGNVVCGEVEGIAEGYVMGRGLQDFLAVSWDADRRDAHPLPDGPLVSNADPSFLVERDQTGRLRSGQPTVGALMAP